MVELSDTLTIYFSRHDPPEPPATYKEALELLQATAQAAGYPSFMLQIGAS